ncbi:HAMP domain-containing sensor histidine kinase [Dyadobacter sp. CY326]|uniref:sensor histidine kinase n=1 Tax=Dyadobacter sp. CY326 TaxID=2907300 RepID=UPI001F16524F|nr:HAMP domain-containing sensor histidine kinase [Dyadobacter sp. CY326]MCE7065208.1 HAMP domain-containing histidine kinase [Dyadobacter sp. CY326]
MKKLLDQSLRPLVIYTLVVLIVSIPVYFLTINWIWENELDKHHYAIREKLEKRLTSLDLPDSAVNDMITVLDKVQPGFSFNEAAAPSPDSTYTLIRFDTFMNDREQFRCLMTDIQVNGTRFRVLIETNMEEIDETILAIAAVTIFFFILLLAGFVYLNRKTSLRVWRPFYETLASLQAFELEGGKPATLPDSQVTEFADLNQGLDRLMEASLASYKQQKEFTENASHELQTPLAIVKSKLDLLLQSRSLDQPQMQILEDAYQAINRVTRINKNLLLLAKIEHAQFDGQQDISLPTLLTAMSAQFADRFESSGIRYTQQVGEMTLQANPMLLEILLTNLLVNALRYTPAGGSVSVRADQGKLIFANTGTSALDEQNLFRRFAQASSEHAGSGLGLAIAREICERYSWQITYEFDCGHHHFTVLF